MKRFILSAVLLSLVFSCQDGARVDNKTLFFKDNLLAWCIVPFDSLERTPDERAAMLKELGIRQLAYDWRLKHVPSFPDEMRALKHNGIRLAAVWVWIEGGNSGGILDDGSEQVFKIVEEHELQTDFWVGFSNANFDGLDEARKMKKAVELVTYLRGRAKAIGCTISLYNHGDWFGEPENQVRIIERSGLKDVGIVYNFHHGHDHIERFPQLLPEMLPYLRTVNLNGMRREGPKILALGEGDRELDMLKTVKSSGFAGTIGIIGHIENKDAKAVLARNIAGLSALLKTMGDEDALATY